MRARVLSELSARYSLETVATPGRSAASALAREAAEAGTDVVIAFGGDGHVNEVANGIAGTEASLGVIPGGTMNVFARNLGVPLAPLKAVAHLMACDPNRPRAVTLGALDDRLFTFCAGCGFDAEAADRVERYRPSKRRFGQAFFYYSALHILLGSRRYRAPTMTVCGDFGERGAAMVIASNAGPYAYFCGRPVVVAPEVSLDAGIELFVLERMKPAAVPVYAYKLLVGGDLARHSDAFYRADLEGFEVRSADAFSRHVDGEPLEPAHSARFKTAPGALRVLAPRR